MNVGNGILIKSNNKLLSKRVSHSETQVSKKNQGTEMQQTLTTVGQLSSFEIDCPVKYYKKRFIVCELKIVSPIQPFENYNEPAITSPKPHFPGDIEQAEAFLFRPELCHCASSRGFVKRKRRRRQNGCNFFGNCLGGKKLRAKPGQWCSNQTAQPSCFFT